MIVFEYMYQMMDVFGPLMDEYAKGEVRHIGNEDRDEVRHNWCHMMHIIAYIYTYVV